MWLFQFSFKVRAGIFCVEEFAREIDTQNLAYRIFQATFFPPSL